jgi:hypothetical protein
VGHAYELLALCPRRQLLCLHTKPGGIQMEAFGLYSQASDLEVETFGQGWQPGEMLPFNHGECPFHQTMAGPLAV